MNGPKPVMKRDRPDAKKLAPAVIRWRVQQLLRTAV